MFLWSYEEKNCRHRQHAFSLAVPKNSAGIRAAGMKPSVL
jgi:hypothetical protein